jgi:hypothetical protein
LALNAAAQRSIAVLASAAVSAFVAFATKSINASNKADDNFSIVAPAPEHCGRFVFHERPSQEIARDQPYPFRIARTGALRSSPERKLR